MGPALLLRGVAALLPVLVSAAVAVLPAMAEVVAFTEDAEHQGDLASVFPVRQRSRIPAAAGDLPQKSTCHPHVCDDKCVQCVKDSVRELTRRRRC
jgi:hypothetical protein